MTTRKERRAELVAGLAYGPRSAPAGDPPYVLIIATGIDPEHIVRGEVLASFTARCVAGAFDSEATVRVLDEMVQTTMTMLRGLEGWSLGEVGRDAVRSYAGGDYLTCDLPCSAFITLDV